MEKTEIVIAGDTPGSSWTVLVLRFKGNDEAAPGAYLQAGLHADELPGSAVLHFLCEKLRHAESNSLLAGDITIVPRANPIGTSQFLYAQMHGRFDTDSGTNFNREFPFLPLHERDSLLDCPELNTAVVNLKSNLLHMALGAEIVIDLHCDYESLLYAYVCEEFWPDAMDFARSMDLHSVFVADGQSSAFDEAVSYAFRHDSSAHPPRRLATTLELRGQSDVDEVTARTDATGLYQFLSARGVTTDKSEKLPVWKGSATPLENIEVVRTPVAGTILFCKSLGDNVKAGELMAKIICEPGDETGIHDVFAPQDGTIITRSLERFAVSGSQLYKMTCQLPTKEKRKAGALEI